MTRCSEAERIALLAARFASAAPGIRVGIGDDAAVLAPDPASGVIVWTVDAQVDGTHFDRRWLSWEDVGWRSFMAAASDLAAMGAIPLAALSSLVLADDVDDVAFDLLTKGQAEAAARIGAPIVGGNLARGRETSVTTTLLGQAASPIARSGARAGEGIFVAGDLGKAAAGLEALRHDRHESELASSLLAWRRPEARIAAGRALAGRASAAVDVSDGLLRDAHHLATASGVALVFEEEALRSLTTSSGLDAAAAVLGRDPLDLALGGGEDYALLVTSREALAGFTRLGRVEAGAGVVLARRTGERTPLEARGFDHFA